MTIHERKDTTMEDEEDGEEIRVNFILDSTITDRSLEVPSDSMAIPSQTRRQGLSAIINHLLDRKVVKSSSTNNDDNDDDSDDDDSDDDDEEHKLESITFDFLIQSKLLRTGVETAARRYGLSLEESVEILYFPAQDAPQESGEGEPLPDWISGIKVLQGDPSIVATVGYDGNLRFHQKREGVLETIVSNTIHEGPIKCLAVNHGKENGCLLATGCLDHTLLSHRYNNNNNNKEKNSKTGAALQGHAKYVEGHKSAIVSVDFSQTTPQLMSGDWDGTLCVWNTTTTTSSSSEAPNKKRKGTTTAAASSIATVHPDLVIPSAHSSQISGIAFGGEQAITGSWDHCVKVWDMETQDCLLTLNGSRVVSCLDLAPNAPIVATGHPDCNVRLWDIRTQQTTTASLVADSSLRPSHKAFISAVQWSPQDPYILASTSHDGTIKLWDIRSSLPLHTVRTHPKEEKSLCLAFGEHVIYTGGTDCIVKQYSC